MYLYPDHRELALKGITKPEADFLRRNWIPNEAGYATLQIGGFYFFLFPQREGAVITWYGHVQHKKFGRESIKDGRMSPEDAKLVLHRKMGKLKAKARLEGKSSQSRNRGSAARSRSKPKRIGLAAPRANRSRGKRRTTRSNALKM